MYEVSQRGGGVCFRSYINSTSGARSNVVVKWRQSVARGDHAGSVRCVSSLSGVTLLYFVDDFRAMH